MMADRQTTGGYTKIATVISIDMPLIAQLKPSGMKRYNLKIEGVNYEVLVEEL